VNFIFACRHKRISLNTQTNAHTWRNKGPEQRLSSKKCLIKPIYKLMPERGEARESRGLKSKRGNNFYAFVNVNIQRYHQKIHWKRLYNKNKKDKKRGSKKLTMQKHRRSVSPLVKGNKKQRILSPLLLWMSCCCRSRVVNSVAVATPTDTTPQRQCTGGKLPQISGVH